MQYTKVMRTLILLFTLLFPLCTFAAGETNPTIQEWHNQFAAYITNPNIIYALLLVAIYGIFFELANPGLILPGVTGIIALLIVLYAFQLILVNYLGLMLILCGIGFMIAEVYIASFGLVGLLGVIGFIAGSILIFDSPDPNLRIDWPLILIMSIISFTFIFIILSLAIKSHKRKITTGREGLIGSEGIVLSVMNEQTVVRVLGEIWDAKSSRMLNPGDIIKVTHVQGLVLFVEPLKKESEGD
jgi:membrane-bound serine protease (ClpP class)